MSPRLLLWFAFCATIGASLGAVACGWEPRETVYSGVIAFLLMVILELWKTQKTPGAP